MILSLCLLILSAVSLFHGVLDVTAAGIIGGDLEQLEILLISRLPPAWPPFSAPAWA